MIVVEGVPVELVDSEFNSLQNGPQKRLQFRVQNSVDPTDHYDLIEAANDAIEPVRKAAGDGKPRKMLLRSEALIAKSGKPWVKFLFVRFAD